MWITYCREHDWFKKELADYLFPSPHEQDASIVDMEVIYEVCNVSNKVVSYERYDFSK